MLDVREMPEVLSAINAILNNGGIFEGKLEYNRETKSKELVVVEITRTVKLNPKKNTERRG